MADILTLLVREFKEFLVPLTKAADSEYARKHLFAALGWELEALSGFPVSRLIEDAAKLSATAASLTEADSPQSFSDVQKLLGDIQSLFNTISDLGQLAQDPNLNLPVDAKTALANLGREMIEFLIVEYLNRNHPLALQIGRLLTFIRMPFDQRTGLSAPIVEGATVLRYPAAPPRVEFDQLGKLISDPVETLKTEYVGASGLATADDARAAAGRLFGIVAPLAAVIGADVTLGMAAVEDSTRDPLRTIAFRFALPVNEVSTAVGAIVEITSDAEGGAGVVLTPTGWVDATWGTRRWVVKLKTSGSISGFTLRRTGPVLPSGTESFSLQLAFQRRSDDGSPAVIVGAPKSTRLELGAVEVAGKVALAASGQDFGLDLLLDRCAVIIQGGDGDGFLQKVLPKDGLRTDFDLGIGWSSKKGLYFRGSAGLEATLPLHVSLLGVVNLDSVYVAIKPQSSDGGISTVGALSASLKLGPVKASVEQIGLLAKLTFPSGGGNLGVANVALGFKPPKGAGLSIDANAVIGGGYLFFDDDKKQYGGPLQLEVKGGLAIKANGLITTKMPDGSPGFSFLIIITVEFSPIQLGYGFTLNGVGGLAGFNRTMQLDALRDGVKNRTLDSIMFPPDPIANAQKIISDLQTVFPAAPGRFVFAPMAKLGWGGSILTIEIGLAVELPSPLRLAIMGKLHLLLPPIQQGGSEEENKTLVELHLDVLGILDLGKSEASVDAILYNSRIALFPISGGMALRLRWGSDPVLVLAIGGLNPRFTPPPGFPTVDRLAFQLSFDKAGVRGQLRMESYLGMTPNTLQFGARIDAYAEVSLAKVAGYLGFDALVEFHPFHLIVDVYGGVSVKAFWLSFSVDMFLTLSGPRPWQGDGHVIVEFFGKHEFAIHFSEGEEDPTPALPPVDPLAEIKTALEDLRNWSAILPAGGSMLVTLRQLDSSEMENKVLAHPLGELTVRQKVLPFGIALERFGAGVPTAPGPFDLNQFHLGQSILIPGEPDKPGLAVRDAFARGQFRNLSEDEKLSQPDFEPFRCGQTRIGTAAITHGPQQKAAFEYDVTVIDDKDGGQKRSSKNSKDNLTPVGLSDDIFLRGAQIGAAGQTPMNAMGSAKFAGPAQGIGVRGPQYVIVSVDDLKRQGTKEFATYTEAEDVLRALGDGQWQIVEAQEAV